MAVPAAAGTLPGAEQCGQGRSSAVSVPTSWVSWSARTALLIAVARSAPRTGPASRRNLRSISASVIGLSGWPLGWRTSLWNVPRVERRVRTVDDGAAGASSRTFSASRRTAVSVKVPGWNHAGPGW